MKTTKRDQAREKRLKKRSALEHARRVCEENEARFDRAIDRTGFDPDNFRPHSD